MTKTLVLFDEATGEDFDTYTVDDFPHYRVGEEFTLNIINKYTDTIDAEPGVTIWEIMRIEHEFCVENVPGVMLQRAYVTLVLRKKS